MSIDDVPGELKWHILLYIPTIDILNVFLLDKSWYNVTHNDNFWKEIGERDPLFVHSCTMKMVKCWKERYKKFVLKGGFRRIESNNPKYHNPSKPGFDFLAKTLLIGDSGVGKTSLMRRFSDNHFSKELICTIGVDFKIISLRDIIEDQVFKVQIWDTGAHGILVCFDLTRKDSLEHCHNWYQEIVRYGSTPEVKACAVLVGCMCDLKEKREVTLDMISEFQQKHDGIKYVETSSLENFNVEKAFHKCMRLVQLNYFNEKKQNGIDIEKIKRQTENRNYAKEVERIDSPCTFC